MFFCGEQLLVSNLQPCNIDGAQHSWAILKLLVGRLREVWPEVKIILRANQFRVLLSAAAYVLLEIIRRMALEGTELAKA
jgi:hypothetical protein